MSHVRLLTALGRPRQLLVVGASAVFGFVLITGLFPQLLQAGVTSLMLSGIAWVRLGA